MCVLGLWVFWRWCIDVSASVALTTTQPRLRTLLAYRHDRQLHTPRHCCHGLRRHMEQLGICATGCEIEQLARESLLQTLSHKSPSLAVPLGALTVFLWAIQAQQQLLSRLHQMLWLRETVCLSRSLWVTHSLALLYVLWLLGCEISSSKRHKNYVQSERALDLSLQSYSSHKGGTMRIRCTNKGDVGRHFYTFSFAIIRASHSSAPLETKLLQQLTKNNNSLLQHIVNC